MFILGDLVTIPPNEDRLPLPWWHRAPLAFESKTYVTLALTQPKARRPGDLLVSVINPHRWDQSFRIRCFYPDKPGTVAKVFGLVATCGWNVDLAETVTVEGGRKHALDLICEPTGEPKPSSVAPLIKKLKAAGFAVPEHQRLGAPNPPVYRHWVGEVQGGWLVDNLGRGLPWREELTKQIHDLRQVDAFDLTKLVMSADTEKRCLRIVVPRKGVQNVVIEHADECGALERLTNALYRAGFNVLSSLLKRGGAPKDNAVLIAICEPVQRLQHKSADVLQARISKEVSKIDQYYRARPTITPGHSCLKVLDARKHGDIVIRVPEDLASKVKKRLKKHKPFRKAVFVSYRFSQPKSYLEEVKKVLASEGYGLDVSPIGPEVASSFEDVSAAMWACNALLVLVATPKDRQSAFSHNLAHEFGFFHGQNKPILWLVQKGKKVREDVEKFTNIKGMEPPSFSKKNALKRRQPDSIASKIKEWLHSDAMKDADFSINSGVF